MANYTIEEFVQATGQQEEARRFFELENPYMLEVNLNGKKGTEPLWLTPMP